MTMQTFSTGATRSADQAKPDYEGFLCPLVLKRYGQYMHQHRHQADGGLRDSDNWQKGIPLENYMKSMWRHFMDLWSYHRGHEVIDQDTGLAVSDVEACCAILFNVMGYMHECLKSEASLL